MKRSRPLVAAALALPLLLAGCTSTPPDTGATDAGAVSASPSASAADGMLPPTTVEPDALEGVDARVIQGTSLVLAVPEGTEAAWTGTTADVAIAEFSHGGPSEGAVYRPGFIVREPGTTAATLTGPDGETVAFTITVVPY